MISSIYVETWSIIREMDILSYQERKIHGKLNKISFSMSTRAWKLLVGIIYEGTVINLLDIGGKLSPVFMKTNSILQAIS